MNRRSFIKTILAALAALILPKARVGYTDRLAEPTAPPDIFTPCDPYTPPGLIVYNNSGDVWWTSGKLGATWEQLDLPPVGNVVWHTPTSLYVYLTDGRIMISHDYGDTWEEIKPNA